MKIHTFCRLLFQNQAIWNRDIDNTAPDHIIEILASKTITSIAQIRNTTLKSYEGKLFLSHNAYGNTKWILPYGVYHRERKLYGLVFCPICLKKDGAHPYYRKYWRLALAVICPICGVFLHEKCPSCQKPVVFFRNDLGTPKNHVTVPISYCYNCGFDLCTSPTMLAPVKETRYQKTLYRILREGWNREVIYPHLYFNVLFQMLKMLRGDKKSHKLLQTDMVKRFSSNYTNEVYFEDRSNRDNFAWLPLDRRTALIKQAFWLLDGFPKRFIAVLKHHHFTSSDLLCDFENPSFWFNKVVIEHFYISNANRKLRLQTNVHTNDEHKRVVAPINGVVGRKRKFSAIYKCGECESNWIIKDGSKRNKRMLKCRNCGKRFPAY